MKVIIYYQGEKHVLKNVSGIKESQLDDRDIIAILFNDNVSYFPAYKRDIEKIEIEIED